MENLKYNISILNNNQINNLKEELENSFGDNRITLICEIIDSNENCVNIIELLIPYKNILNSINYSFIEKKKYIISENIKLLEKLPEPYYSKVIFNLKNCSWGDPKNIKFNNLKHLIGSGFRWGNTLEKSTYWSKFYHSII